MSTSIGTYADPTAVWVHMGNSGSPDAALQSFCDQVNGWIEYTTGRVLAPLPRFTSTLSAPASIGALTVTLASTTGLQAGDELAFGPVTGTHESSPVVDATSGTVTLGVALANAYATSAPVERVYLRDGFDASVSDDMVPGRILVEDRGIVTLTALEIASFTRGAFSVIPLGDIWLRPVVQQRQPGWPATEMVMTNIPSPNNPYPAFFPGYGNIREWGQLGWPAAPDEIVAIAERVTVALWQMRAGGGAYQVSPPTDGATMIPHLLSYDDWRTLKGYQRKSLGII
jgi:hypothetical protein